MNRLRNSIIKHRDVEAKDILYFSCKKSKELSKEQFYKNLVTEKIFSLTNTKDLIEKELLNKEIEEILSHYIPYISSNNFNNLDKAIIEIQKEFDLELIAKYGPIVDFLKKKI